MTVAVIGGGITGLSAAHRLATAGEDVVVFEADNRVGGKIHTDRLGDHVVELGPDMFLGRVPWALELVDELGLTDQLVTPATSTAFIMRNGRPRRLPPEQVLGAPTEILPLLRSGAVSLPGLVRAGFDLILPTTDHDEDASVGAIVRARFGDEICDRLVDPLVGGINAGAIDRLSASSTAAPLAEAARGRSLLRGLRDQRRRTQQTAAADLPPFRSLQAGLEQLVQTLVAAIVRLGATVEVGVEIDEIATDAAECLLRPRGGEPLRFDAVVIAVPAAAAARLVRPVVPAAADALAGIRTASVGVHLAAFAPDDISALPEGSGLLSPPIDGRLVTAVSIASNKWPHWLGDDSVVLRTSVGRVDDTRWLDRSDDELSSDILAELAELVGLRSDPKVARIVRWEDGFPQYDVGHRARIRDVRAAMRAGGAAIEVVGASIDGLGIPACIRQGREAAGRILERRGRIDA